MRSGIAYKFKCGGCNVYYGKTKRHFKVRMCEHLGVSALTGKRVKGDNGSAIKKHHLFCSHSSGFDNFSILASNNNDYKVTLMESLLEKYYITRKILEKYYIFIGKMNTWSINPFTGELSHNFKFLLTWLIASYLELEVSYFQKYESGSSFQLKFK